MRRGHQTAPRLLSARSAARVAALLVVLMLATPGCVSRVYAPGPADSPLRGIALGQSYGDMTRVLGEPDQSWSEDRMGMEMFILFVPIWGLAEWIWNFHPSATQVYTYDAVGTVTIGDENRILRVEASPELPRQ